MVVQLDSWMDELALVVIAAALVLWVCYFRHFSYWTEKGAPQSRPWTPFGNCYKSILQKQMLSEDLDELYRRFRDKRYVGYYRGLEPRLLVIDPNLIRQILVKDFDFFTDREPVPLDDPILEGQLFFMKGDRWRRLRNKLSPLFTSGKLKHTFQTLNECGSEMVEVLADAAREGKVLQFREVFALYTTEVIATLAFGVKLNCQRNPDCDFRMWGRILFQPRARPFKEIATEIFTPPLKRYLDSIAPRNNALQFFDNMVKETLHDRLENAIRRSDFMDLFIQLHTKGFVEGEKQGGTDWKLSENEVSAQAFLFYIAGFETSSTTMSFAAYELAVNPDIQQRVLKEIDSVLAESGEISYESLAKMKYLDRVLSETLRKYPPVPTLTRQVQRPYRLPGADGEAEKGALLEPGVVVMVPAFSLHYDPTYFPEPHRFDPDRWTDEAKAALHPFVYMPFGEGPRFCIGMRLGLLQSKLGLVHLLSHYKVDVCSETDIPLPLDPMASILATKNGVYLKITSRKPV
ncbi:probable cytochrome P450 6a14 isoform X1 [Schistocerca gregaria]|uniref:probable cytochrome P450 6a14 isoform X1 n=1 Tax=Schistocerca gregaria TaxID=7010 RepID=UPI00211DD157|nr:probable cytochrome P450 6a14 isoform X1 [Schistocerca gregaria]